jgi:hypothetical protein
LPSTKDIRKSIPQLLSLVYSMPRNARRARCYSTHAPSPNFSPSTHASAQNLERVVLWWYLDVEVTAQDGYLLHDVLTYTRYLGEEEESEETGYAAKPGCESTAASKSEPETSHVCSVCGGRTMVDVRLVEVAGCDAMEVGLDLVSAKWLVSCSAVRCGPFSFALHGASLRKSVDDDSPLVCPLERRP